MLKSGNDAVFVAAEDGGYTLLGLNQTTECLFDKLPWGTEFVAEITRNCMNGMGWKWIELNPLWDVDTPADFIRWKGE